MVVLNDEWTPGTLPKEWKVDNLMLDPTEDPNLTPKQRLYETSHGLVAKLLALIDSYGHRGVLRTLEDIKEVYLPEQETTEQAPQSSIPDSQKKAPQWVLLPDDGKNTNDPYRPVYIGLTETRYYRITCDDYITDWALNLIVDKVGVEVEFYDVFDLGAKKINYDVWAPHLLPRRWA